MTLNPNIILAGQGVNALQALSQGNEAGARMADIRRAGEVQNLYRTQGPGIMAGETNALAALSRFDPAAALGIEGTRLGMDETRQGMRIREEQLQLARAAGAREAQRFAMTLSAEQRAEEQRQIAQGLATAIPALRSGNLDSVNQIFRTAGIPAVGSLDEAALAIAGFEGAMQAFEGAQAVMGVQPAPEIPAAMQTLQMRAAEAGLQPGTPEYQQFMLEGAGSGTTVTVQNTLPGQNTFDEAFARQDAEALSVISTAGLQAQRNLPRIDTLQSLLNVSPSGFSAALAARAGEFGINTDGLSDLQAAQAIINSLVPEQRQPGSGPMSDADLALFQQSLPRLINTPEGNRQIIGTMRAIAEYDAQGSRIVQRLRSGEISRAEAFIALQSRENPLAAFSPSGATQPSGGEGAAAIPPPPANVTPEQWQQLWQYMSPEDRALFQ